MGRSLLVPLMLGTLVLVTVAPATEPSRSERDRVDAQMLLELDLLSDERFAERAHDEASAHDRPDDYEFPAADDRGGRGQQPRT